MCAYLIFVWADSDQKVGSQSPAAMGTDRAVDDLSQVCDREPPESCDNDNEAADSVHESDSGVEGTQDRAESEEIEQPQEETRRVPKVTLKLPKSVAKYIPSHDGDSDDSDKLTMEVDEVSFQSFTRSRVPTFTFLKNDKKIQK